MENPSLESSGYLHSEKRISQWTLVFGVLAALLVGYFRNWLWGSGVLIGAALSWFNFRWLRQGLDALTGAATAQAHAEKVHVPIMTYVKAALRYGLIGLAVYATFKYLNVPLLSMIFGLGALGAATLAVSVHEILRPSD